MLQNLFPILCTCLIFQCYYYLIEQRQVKKIEEKKLFTREQSTAP